MEILDDRVQSGVGTEITRILSKDLFLYLLDYEVKRALRYQNFISILLMRLVPYSRDNDGTGFKACQQTLVNMLTQEMRETDILGFIEENRLVALLPYADATSGAQARSRFESTLKYYDFESWGYEVMVQQFCFPRNGTNTTDLIKKTLVVELFRGS
jgi:hypothetical protein